MLIRSGEVVLRGFEPPLSDDLYGVRNHPSVRQYLRDTLPITRESHDRWVEDNLIKQRRVQLFVVFGAAVVAGIALLRNFAGDSAEVGLMMVEAQRRRLISYKAAHLIGYYGLEVLGLERLVSYVPRHNQHALAFNLGCGFERTGVDPDPYYELVLTRERSRCHPIHRRFRARYPIEMR
jgi:RimJ/RimL family protein N-acetyltransferase